MTTSQLVIKDWKKLPPRKALGPSEIVTALARLDGWTLNGDGAQVAIEKTYRFANYFETIAFVNALALVAHREDHHPDLSVHYNRCVVRFNTHDVGGISRSDLDCAQQVDTLLQPHRQPPESMAGRPRSATARQTAIPTALREGLVVGSHGRHCVVESADGSRRICHPRGKKSQAVVGDRVLWQASEDEGTIERVQERRNLFYRQDEIRTKSFAANLDQVLILIAAEPEFSEQQLVRALIAAEAQRITPILALNKSDLVVPFERAWAKLEPYRRMRHVVLPLSLRAHADANRAVLMKLLAGKSTLVLGPSGSGKSTLTNLLVPGAAVLTQEISQALNSGKHTTTSTTWYWIDEARTTGLIDSPGFQEFGLNHIEPMQLASLMPDIAEHTGDCKFYNCTHLHEPGCDVIANVETPTHAGPISASRYRIYGLLFAELSQTRY